MAKKSPIILQQRAVPKASNIPRMDIEMLFATNVVELYFRRRTDITNNDSPGHNSDTRRMLCTSNFRYISNPKVRQLFKWKRPGSKRGKAFYRGKRLLIVWDFMKNNFRMISLDKYKIVSFLPLIEFEELANWSGFYRKNIKNLPENLKNHFSDR